MALAPNRNHRHHTGKEKEAPRTPLGYGSWMGITPSTGRRDSNPLDVMSERMREAQAL